MDYLPLLSFYLFVPWRSQHPGDFFKGTLSYQAKARESWMHAKEEAGYLRLVDLSFGGLNVEALFSRPRT